MKHCVPERLHIWGPLFPFRSEQARSSVGGKSFHFLCNCTTSFWNNLSWDASYFIISIGYYIKTSEFSCAFRAQFLCYLWHQFFIDVAVLMQWVNFIDLNCVYLEVTLIVINRTYFQVSGILHRIATLIIILCKGIILSEYTKQWRGGGGC